MPQSGTPTGERYRNLDTVEKVKALLYAGWTYEEIAAEVDVSVGTVCKIHKQLEAGTAYNPPEIYRNIRLLNKQVFNGPYKYEELSELFDTVEELPTLAVFPAESDALSLMELVEIASIAEDYYETVDDTMEAARQLADDVDRQVLLEHALEEQDTGAAPPSMNEVVSWHKVSIEEGRTMREAVKQKGEMLS